MGMLRIEQSVTGAAPSVTYTGGGWTTASADSATSGGTYALNSTAGQSVAINVPTGKSGILIGTLMTAQGTGVVGVSVDGGAATNYSLGTGATTNSQNYHWYQSCLPPISFSNTAVTHTVTLTNVSGTIYLDFVEFYDTSTAIVAGTLVGFGHSILYGFQGTTVPLNNPVASTFVREVSRNLGFTLGNTFNQGIPGEDLANGKANASTNPQFYSNDYSPEPAWRRAATGTSAGPFSWAVSSNLVGQVAVTAGGSGYTSDPAVGFSGGGGTLAAAVANRTGNAVTGITMTNHGINYTSAPTVSITGGAGTGATGTATLAFTVAATNTWWVRQPEVALVMHAYNDMPHVQIYDPGTGGAAGSPAGTGWTLRRFKQRLKELCWRMNLNSPNTLIVLCGPSFQNTFSIANGNVQTLTDFSEGIALVAGDATVKNAIYCDLYGALKSVAGITPGTTPNYALQDAAHPTAAGEIALAAPIISAIRRARASQTMRVR